MFMKRERVWQTKSPLRKREASQSINTSLNQVTERPKQFSWRRLLTSFFLSSPSLILGGESITLLLFWYWFCLFQHYKTAQAFLISSQLFLTSTIKTSGSTPHNIVCWTLLKITFSLVQLKFSIASNFIKPCYSGLKRENCTLFTPLKLCLFKHCKTGQTFPDRNRRRSWGGWIRKEGLWT